MVIKQAINYFMDYLTIERGYSPQTIKAYKNDLLSFVMFLQNKGRASLIEKVKQADILAFLAYLTNPNSKKQPNSATTRARKLAAIRSFFTFLRKRKFLLVNPADDIDIPSLPIKEPDYLSITEYQRLLETVQKTASPFFKLRDILIISLFLSSGLRVSELVGLEMEHVDLENKSIKIHRKRNKYQNLPITDEVAKLFTDYFHDKPMANTKKVFISKKHNGMKANTVYCVVRKYLQLAGIKKDTFGCHLLRHSCFSALLANDVNLVVIQQLAGHSSLSTTQRYLHLNNNKLREAVQKINLRS